MTQFEGREGTGPSYFPLLPLHQHDRLGDRELVFRSELVFPLQVPGGGFSILLRGGGEIELALFAEEARAVADREAEGAADQGAVLVDHAGAGGAEGRARNVIGAGEEGFLLIGGAFAEGRVIGRFHDRFGPGDDRPALLPVEGGESLRDRGNIGRADLEQAVAAEGASEPAGERGRLLFRDLRKKAVGRRQNLLVVGHNRTG